MEVDVSWKEYFRDDARYVDIINGIGCGGQQLVNPEDLQEADSQTILGRLYRVLGKSGKRYVRDMVRKVAFGVNFENTGVFRTDVKQVFDFIRCSGDKASLLKLVQNDEKFRCMEEDAYEVVTNYVKADELIQVKDEYRREDGKVDMCQALKDLIEDGRIEGRAEGHSTAIKSIVIKMVNKGKSDEEIMELTECSAELIWEIRAGADRRTK